MLPCLILLNPPAPSRRAQAGAVFLSDRRYSTALTMSSTTFFASPNTIIVLSM